MDAFCCFCGWLCLGGWLCYYGSAWEGGALQGAVVIATSDAQ